MEGMWNDKKGRDEMEGLGMARKEGRGRICEE